MRLSPIFAPKNALYHSSCSHEVVSLHGERSQEMALPRLTLALPLWCTVRYISGTGCVCTYIGRCIAGDHSDIAAVQVPQ